MTMIRFALALLALLAAPLAAQDGDRPPVTILISVDGMRSDYLDRGITPNLAALAAGGVRAAMRASFPTLTFPNHTAIVTGLRPDRSGIVDNNMEDARRPGVRFMLADTKQALDPFWWSEAEPLWVTAERAGVRTATMFWPSSEVPFGTSRPSDWFRYDKAVTNVQRVNTLIDWLRRPVELRPKLLTLYFDTVDTAGHTFGPGAPETASAISDVDQRIGDLVAALRDLKQPANLVIVADHGMADVDFDQLIRLDKLVDAASIHVVAEGAMASLSPAPGKGRAVERVLLAPQPHMQCWRKAEIPARFAYGRNARVPAIVCLAQPGWWIVAPDSTRTPPKGAHGYDPALPEMAATFVANGPAIRRAVSLPSFDNVDVYPLVMRLIGVAPLPGRDAGPAALAALTTEGAAK